MSTTVEFALYYASCNSLRRYMRLTDTCPLCIGFWYLDSMFNASRSAPYTQPATSAAAPTDGTRGSPRVPIARFDIVSVTCEGMIPSS